MLTGAQYRILKWISPGDPGDGVPEPEGGGPSKLVRLLGPELLARVRGRRVADFGCGEGWEAVELARLGAREVIGIDIREEMLERARRRAAASGVETVCRFARETSQPVEIVVSLDAFEHFEDPAGVLGAMDRMLASDGEVWISFGPPWLHPLGGHLFSILPWAHLIFSEEALMRWRSDFKTDGARRFGEVSGGLNRMTIRRFLRYVEASAFEFVQLETTPIRKLRPLHNRWTREFTTSVVRCRLRKKSSRRAEMDRL
jgi:SAM-dependent methyltransferase